MKLPAISFSQHPASVGETYAEHFQTAMSFSAGMIGGGLACLVHGFLPFLFEGTGSATIRDLHERMILHRSRLSNLTNGPELAATSLKTEIPGGALCTKASS
jgi:hypothetical protein